MIRIIEGPPGSGKSYFMVNYLSHFFKYDAFYDEFVLKDKVLLISNIEGLRVKHLDLKVLLQKYTIEEFFTVSNFETIQKKYGSSNIILLIDEAQELFDRKFYDKDVFFFFQYHRHLGVDVILGTQGANLLANAFIPLCEFIVEAIPRSKSIVGNFTYYFKDKRGKFMYSKVLRKNNVIFRAYKSFTSDEISKPKNVVLHWAFIGAVLVFAGLFLMKSALAIVKGKSEKANAAQKIADNRLKSPPPVVPPSGSPSPSVVVPLPVQRPLSSARVALASDPEPVVTVKGFVTESSGKRRYLLSDGSSVVSSRILRLNQKF